jgi:hypothetical protein
MKLWSFIKWQWNKWETWQRWFAVMFFLFGLGLSSSSVFSIVCLYISVSIFAYFVTKWCIVDPIRNSWEGFKKEQDDLFDVIKDSDKK